MSASAAFRCLSLYESTRESRFAAEVVQQKRSRLGFAGHVVLCKQQRGVDWGLPVTLSCSKPMRNGFGKRFTCQTEEHWDVGPYLRP
eukprot:341868-Pleurochrysis_carterae.AAC.4